MVLNFLRWVAFQAHWTFFDGCQNRLFSPDLFLFSASTIPESHTTPRCLSSIFSVLGLAKPSETFVMMVTHRHRWWVLKVLHSIGVGVPPAIILQSRTSFCSYWPLLVISLRVTMLKSPPGLKVGRAKGVERTENHVGHSRIRHYIPPSSACLTVDTVPRSVFMVLAVISGHSFCLLVPLL